MSELIASDMKRGATPSPRHELAAAIPFEMAEYTPLNTIYIPNRMSFWGNDKYGDCVTAEEAFAKVCIWPNYYFADDSVIRWAADHNYLNGANISRVLQTMQTDGFKGNNGQYNDGRYYSVNYMSPESMRNAISQGPVKIGVAAKQFSSVTPGRNGWFLTNLMYDTNYDHCVSLCGYGSISWLASQLGVSVPNGINGENPGYAMFTWNSIGIIDQASLNNIICEAWLRIPTTVVRYNP